MPDSCSAGLRVGLRINVLTQGMSPGRYSTLGVREAPKHFEIRSVENLPSGNTLSRDKNKCGWSLMRGFC